MSTNFELKYGLKIKKIQFVDEHRSFNDIEIDIMGNNEELTNDRINIYKAKESTNLSNKSFEEFIRSGANFPSLFTVQKFQLRLNGLFEPLSNTKGFYFNPEYKILFYLKNFINCIDLSDKKISIRLAADGTQIAKNLTFLNISFQF